MKNIVFGILLFSQFIAAQTDFEKANEHYRKGDYKSAATLYENVLKSKKESAELYFNLANAYYKLDEVAPAIYNYEKALLLDPGNKDITTNLRFAQKMQIDDIREVPKVGFSKFVSDFTSVFHYDTWAWVAVSLAFAFLLFFVGYYFATSAKQKRIFFALMGFAFALIFVSAAIALFERNRIENERPAIVFAAVVSVKNEPAQSAEDAFKLHEGTKVLILESLDNWRKVTLPDGNSGWLQSNVIRELKN